MDNDIQMIQIHQQNTNSIYKIESKHETGFPSLEASFAPDTLQTSAKMNSKLVSKVIESKLNCVSPPPLPNRPRSITRMIGVNNTKHTRKTTSETEEFLTVHIPPTTKQDSSCTVVDGYEKHEATSTHSSQLVQDPSILTIPPSSNYQARRKVIGKWELGKTIGEGSSGKVKLAVHSETREKVLL
jgi:hypothetical protein